MQLRTNSAARTAPNRKSEITARMNGGTDHNANATIPSQINAKAMSHATARSF